MSLALPEAPPRPETSGSTSVAPSARRQCPLAMVAEGQAWIGTFSGDKIARTSLR